MLINEETFENDQLFDDVKPSNKDALIGEECADLLEELYSGNNL